MERYDANDAIAGVYNRHWGYFADRIYPVLHRLVLRDLPPGCAVLDLCCGTGQLAAVLSEGTYILRLTTGVCGAMVRLKGVEIFSNLWNKKSKAKNRAPWTFY